MHKQPGFILFMTFSILALCAALVSAFMIKGFTHKKLSATVLAQECLEQLALSTPALAQSFLSFSAQDLKEIAKEKSPQPGHEGVDQKQQVSTSFEKMLLEKVLPVVNLSQKFNLKEINKDLPYVVSLTFFAESGKININGLYDLINKSFYGEGTGQANAKTNKAGTVQDQKVFATWLFDRIAAIMEKPSLMNAFVEHVKQRKVPFNDVTELLVIKEFADCFSDAVFYEGLDEGQTPHKKDKKIFLTDLFTVASENDTIQPWLLSPSVCALLNIKTKEKSDQGDKKEKNIDLASFKQQADWAKDWDPAFKQIYEVSYDKIPEQVRSVLACNFSATVFSIIASVTYTTPDEEDDRCVKIFALLKEKKLPDSSIVYDVIKMYSI